MTRPACPRCGYAYTDRVKRNLMERIVSLFISRHRWYCESCRCRFWSPHQGQSGRTQ